MNTAIETHGLSKHYGRVCAIEAVSISVKPGEIYGFIGLNGAGKTTTIRALLGMIRPTTGTVELLGQPVGPNGRGPWQRVGHLVEAPAAYPELSVRENLEVARRLRGVSDKRATSRVIERLGLAAYTDQKAGVLSTGNLQRLGLARALLHGPDVLILDEPANGLDPAGVAEIREFLATLARDEGVTVFMSSHILTEVDRLATRIGIIHRGRLIEELDAEALEALRAHRLEIKAPDLDGARRALTNAGFTASMKGDTLIVCDAAAIEAPENVATLLVGVGTPPSRLAVTHEDLEAYFLRLTGETL